MRRKYKRLFCYTLITGFLLNFVFVCYLLLESEFNIEELHPNELLILDWTGKQHIFREKDPIHCNFSHITLDYCQEKFPQFIERCSRLPTLILRWTTDRSRSRQATIFAYHSLHIPSRRLPRLKYGQFSMVYILESEVHSTNGNRWHEIDFAMWYNLERSYPEPATYFDLQIYLEHLFKPVQIPFEHKQTTASIVWISSNCHAYNGRHVFVKKLMSFINIDSYGHCLNNRVMPKKSNIEIYSRYKFVLAIENSNCEDYVTEKLVQAFSSTSIPIVAGRDGKPDYQRFAPDHSYINVYDYPTMEKLVNYLNYLSNNQTAYNEYLWFRSTKKNETFEKRSLVEYLHLAAEIFNVQSSLYQWLLTKETNRNKFCKLTEYLHTNDWNEIYQRKKFNRPSAEQVCLSQHDLIKSFIPDHHKPVHISLKNYSSDKQRQ